MNNLSEIFDDVLNEQNSEIKRSDYNNVFFRINEIEKTLMDSLEQLNKLESSVPYKIDNLTKKDLLKIRNYISLSIKSNRQLNYKIKNFKKKN